MSEGVVLFKSNVMINHLIPFLSVIDYINFRLTCHMPKGLISPSDLLLQRFKHHIRALLSDENEEIIATLISFLTQRDDVYLSGGFLVALLRGDVFNKVEQDLDFYFTDESLLRTSALNKNEEINFDEGAYDGSVDSIRVQTGVYNNIRIQFVLHISVSSMRYGINHFDIPLCRNAYNYFFGLRLGDLKSLTSSQCIVPLRSWYERVRNVKYQTTLKDKYDRLKYRVEKYRARGFEITFESDLERDDFVRSIEYVPHITKRDEIYRLMGKHNPDSCIFAKDCRCKGAGDTKARYCDTKRCSCEHHAVFYRELKERWAEELADKMWEEYEEHWSKVVLPPRSGVENHNSPKLKKAKH